MTGSVTILGIDPGLTAHSVRPEPVEGSPLRQRILSAVPPPAGRSRRMSARQARFSDNRGAPTPQLTTHNSQPTTSLTILGIDPGLTVSQPFVLSLSKDPVAPANPERSPAGAGRRRRMSAKRALISDGIAGVRLSICLGRCRPSSLPLLRTSPQARQLSLTGRHVA